MVARPGACDIEQVPFGVVDVFEIGLVGDGLDALLQRDHFVVAGHDRDRAEFQSLGEMHRADRDPARRDLDPVGEFERLDTGFFDRVPYAAKLAGRADKYADLMRLNALSNPSSDPFADSLGLLFRIIEGLDCRGWAVEHRYGAAAILGIAVDIGQ